MKKGKVRILKSINNQKNILKSRRKEIHQKNVKIVKKKMLKYQIVNL